MNFTKLILDVNYGNYSFRGASNAEMGILGLFLTDDVGCSEHSYSWPSYQDWTLDDSLGECVSGNITVLEKEGDYVYLTDQCPDPEEKKPAILKISRTQFVKLLDDWREKVCETKPKEVIIKHENDQFVIETKK